MLETTIDSPRRSVALQTLTQLARRFLERQLRARWREGFLTVHLPDGETWRLGDPDAREQGSFEILDERFFLDVVLGGELGAGESYVEGRWRSRALPALLGLFVRNFQTLGLDGPLQRVRRLGSLLGHRRRKNDRAGARRNIAAHYDLGNEFYQLFLDESMAYSCAVYRSAEDTLEEAQRNKYERICDKLRLSPADHLLEIGSGWGGFAIHAARTRGCRVTTITISQRQLEEAQARVAAAGVSGLVTVRFADYRELEGRYDKIVSIEMFEAIGHRYFGDYFAACDRLLERDGIMLLQTIAMPHRRFVSYVNEVDWMQKYIFPGCCIPSLEAMTRAMARRSTLTLHDLEDIGVHYAPTLRAWRERFFQRLEDVRAQGFDERFIRTWEMYLSFSEAAFAERSLFDLQLLLTRPNNRALPAYDDASSR